MATSLLFLWVFQVPFLVETTPSENSVPGQPCFGAFLKSPAMNCAELCQTGFGEGFEDTAHKSQGSMCED